MNMRTKGENYVRISVQRRPFLEGKEISDYDVPVSEEMTLLQALDYIYENLDSTLAFRRYCCGGQFCNSCLVEANGRVTHACVTKVKPGDCFLLKPVPGRRVIRDLVVDPAPPRCSDGEA